MGSELGRTHLPGSVRGDMGDFPKGTYEGENGRDFGFLKELAQMGAKGGDSQYEHRHQCQCWNSNSIQVRQRREDNVTLGL